MKKTVGKIDDAAARLGRRLKIDVRTFWCKDKSVVVEIKGNSLTFETLRSLSRLFKTKLIDVSGHHSNGGCPTCDYGSEQWIEISIGEATIPSSLLE